MTHGESFDSLLMAPFARVMEPLDKSGGDDTLVAVYHHEGIGYCPRSRLDRSPAMQFPAADPSSTTKVVSLVTCVLLLALPLGLFLLADLPTLAALGVALMSALILGVTWALAPRAYEVDGHALVVHRGVGLVSLPLAEIRACRVDPTAMDRSWRLMGSGGLFGFFGLFRNAHLGTYRAFATDPKQAVVIESAGKPWVLTPAEPASLARRLEDAIRAASR